MTRRLVVLGVLAITGIGTACGSDTSGPVEATVALTSPSATMTVGDKLQLTTAVTDSKGKPITGRVVTYVSSAPTVASVSTTGEVTALTPGTATITASVPTGKAGTVGLTIKAEQWAATLNGVTEIPNTPSTATGTATLTFGAADTISYDVTLTNPIDSVTASHYHAAPPGVPGGIVLGILPNQNPPIPRVSGLLVAGKITRAGASTAGGFNGAFTYDTLVVRLRAGQLYVNVHTRKFPGGEIRGNFAKVAP